MPFFHKKLNYSFIQYDWRQYIVSKVAEKNINEKVEKKEKLNMNGLLLPSSKTKVPEKTKMKHAISITLLRYTV